MPYAEDAHCLFIIMPKGDGKPARIQFEFIDKTLAALEGCVFFTLKKGITWEQAEELAVQLNQTVATMNVTEYASGLRTGRNFFARPKLGKFWFFPIPAVKSR
jgi:hypothetical protein